MPTVLLIEDEETLSRALQFSLEREGFTVRVAADGLTGLSLARELKHDLILLDLMLPGVDGLEVCRRIRAESSVPILMLTAKADEVDRVVGLELGADDYVTKPFSVRELVARIRAQLRRGELLKRTELSSRGAILAYQGLELDLSRRVVLKDKVSLQLRPKAFELLAFFLRSPGIVFSRETLLERVWGFDYVGDSRTVDVHMFWLREKIEDHPAEPTRLITVRGVGYKFEP